MITFCSKTICPIASIDGKERLGLYNSIIEDTTPISYLGNDGKERYRMDLDGSQKAGGQRALHYSRFFLGNSIESTKRIIPFVDLSRDDLIIDGKIKRAVPLFETITPSILTMDSNDKLPTIIFWSNLNSPSFPQVSHSGAYIYSSDSIYKFNENELEEETFSASTNRILCSARMRWEFLRRRVNGVVDENPVPTLIVEAVSIILVQSDGWVVDFSTGGSGGSSLGRHNHSNNAQGGFAYGTIAPGTMLQPINWT